MRPFYHFALARRLGAEPVAFLNLGGVGNVTWADPSRGAPESDGALLAFDTGPANALLDDWMRRVAGLSHDADGRAAASGAPDRDLVARWMTHPYFGRPAPKSLDREAFAGCLDDLAGASLEDGAATLLAYTVESVAAAAERLPAAPTRWLVCGGGRHNATMMAALGSRLPGSVEPIDAAGFDGDVLEAQAFAFLAVRSQRGLPLSAPGTTGVPHPICGGRLVAPVASP